MHFPAHSCGFRKCNSSCRKGSLWLEGVGGCIVNQIGQQWGLSSTTFPEHSSPPRMLSVVPPHQPVRRKQNKSHRQPPYAFQTRWHRTTDTHGLSLFTQHFPQRRKTTFLHEKTQTSFLCGERRGKKKPRKP